MRLILFEFDPVSEAFTCETLLSDIIDIFILDGEDPPELLDIMGGNIQVK